MARANDGFDVHVTRHQSRAGHSTLIKAQFFALNMAAERGMWNEMEATHQRWHDQRRRLEAVDCDCIRYAFL